MGDRLGIPGVVGFIYCYFSFWNIFTPRFSWQPPWQCKNYLYLSIIWLYFIVDRHTNLHIYTHMLVDTYRHIFKCTNRLIHTKILIHTYIHSHTWELEHTNLFWKPKLSLILWWSEVNFGVSNLISWNIMSYFLTLIWSEYIQIKACCMFSHWAQNFPEHVLSSQIKNRADFHAENHHNSINKAKRRQWS